MSRIELKDVSVEFPIYSANSRSLKSAVLSATTGGRVGKDRHNYVCVRALDQVSIDIQHGERVGLVGHNGAGKTTLLRVIAGIYEPLQGSVVIEGTPTPMFDVSLGIDADATGLENIVLRGLYMGLSKAEILRKMDDVAEFHRARAVPRFSRQDVLGRHAGPACICDGDLHRARHSASRRGDRCGRCRVFRTCQPAARIVHPQHRNPHSGFSLGRADAQVLQQGCVDGAWPHRLVRRC